MSIGRPSNRSGQPSDRQSRYQLMLLLISIDLALITSPCSRLFSSSIRIYHSPEGEKPVTKMGVDTVVPVTVRFYNPEM